MALLDVVPEARALVHSQDAIDAANDAADHASNDRTNRPRGARAFARAMLDAGGHALRGRDHGHHHDGPDNGNQKTTTDLHFHLSLL